MWVDYLVWDESTKTVEKCNREDLYRFETVGSIECESSCYYVMPSEPLEKLDEWTTFGDLQLQEGSFIIIINNGNPDSINLTEIWNASEDARTKMPVYCLIWDERNKQLQSFVFNVFKAQELWSLELNDFFDYSIQYFALSNEVLSKEVKFGELSLITNENILFIVTNAPEDLDFDSIYQNNFKDLDLESIYQGFNESIPFCISCFNEKGECFKIYKARVYKSQTVNNLKNFLPKGIELTFIVSGQVINSNNMFGQLPLNENNLIIVIFGKTIPAGTKVENWSKLCKDSDRFNSIMKSSIKTESNRLRDLRDKKSFMKKTLINKVSEHKQLNSEQNLNQQTNLDNIKADKPSEEALPIIW